jgi:2-iminobutanoate/2-iminopropanoate deaminase
MLKQALVIAAAGFFTASVHAADAGLKYVIPPKVDARPAPPFSNAVISDDAVYVAGHIGLDAATGQAAANIETEAHLVMDAVKQTLEEAGLTMDNLASVTVYCTDLDLYDKFNAVYRTYFHGQYPARAFIGVNKLVRNAHFEVAGIAVKPPGTHKL